LVRWYHFVVFMTGFKKVYNFIALILTPIQVFFYLGIAYPSEYTLRVPLGQYSHRIVKVIDTQVKVGIKFVPQGDFIKYADMLIKMSRDEKSAREEFAIEDDFPAWLCFTMAGEIRNAGLYPGKSEILALFVVTDEKDNLIGAKIVKKPHYIKDINERAVDGMDIVSFRYRRKGIGTMLRKAAFEWMVKQGYDKYVALIRKKDSPSFNNLKKIADEAGFIIKTNPKVFKKPWGPSRYYTIRLRDKRVEGDSLPKNLKKLELSKLLYELDNPKVKKLITDLMTFGYSQIGVTRAEVEEMVRIMKDNKDDLMKARQALYDAGFNWTRKGNRYHNAYRAYKSNVRYNTTFSLIKDYIDEGDIIADIGCGDDRLGVIIVDNIKNTRVIGTDVVDYRDKDYKPHERVDFVLQKKNGKIPLKRNSVNKVLFSAVFHHDTAEITDKLLKEAKRILKPNGEVIILEDVVLEGVAPKNNEEGLIDRFKALTKEERRAVIAIFDWYANHVVIGETQIPMALNYQTEEEWEQTSARAGFEIKTKDFVGIYKGKVHAQPHTLLVLKAAPANKVKETGVLLRSMFGRIKKLKTRL